MGDGVLPRYYGPPYWWDRWRFGNWYRIAERQYCNPDSRCKYPYMPYDCLDYCWSYAHHIDGTAGYEDMEAICSRRPCEFWKERPDEEV